MGGVKKLVSVKIKLLLFTVINNTVQLCTFSPLEKNHELIYWALTPQSNEDDRVDVIWGKEAPAISCLYIESKTKQQPTKKIPQSIFATSAICWAS